MDLVVGGGKYGTWAARYLIERQRQFVVVDPDPGCLAAAEIHGPGSGRLLVGGMETVYQVIRECSPELVFPTAPVHVAAGLVCEAGGFRESPDDIGFILDSTPTELVVGTRGGSLFLSLNRDDTCLPDCPAPDTCPVTGEDRTDPLHDRLRRFLPDAFILESRQVSSGLGALSGRDIVNLLDKARGMDMACVGTACRCHGVVTALVSGRVADTFP